MTLSSGLKTQVADAIDFPSALQETPEIGPRCRSTTAPGAPSLLQTFTWRSSSPVTRRVPSGDHATQRTIPLDAGTTFLGDPSASQIRKVPPAPCTVWLGAATASGLHRPGPTCPTSTLSG